MKIKIELEKGQTPEQAEEQLFKALDFQRSGDTHSEEFTDPVMEEVARKMIEAHGKVWAESLAEIEAILDEEYE